MTGFLLDTNVVGELVRPRPDELVARWIERRRVEELHLSTLTIGELTRGAAKLGDTARSASLRRWIDALALQFEGRLLAFDLRAARRWGDTAGRADRAGGPLPAADAQIAAIALVHGLRVVTRNVRDFDRMVPDAVDPFAPDP